MAVSNVGYATLAVIPSVKNIGTKLKEQVVGPSGPAGEEAGKKTGEGLKKGIGGSLGSIGKTIAGAFVVEKGFDVFKDAINDANDYRRTANLTAAAIKSTGGAANVSASYIATLSDKFAEQDGITKGVAQSVANMVLRYKSIKDTGTSKVFDETTQAALNMAAATGKSATAAATQLGRALDNPTKNLSALTRSGVTFTAGQTKLIQKLASSGHLLQAQNLILDQVKVKFGGAAAAAATPLSKLKTSANELQLAIGAYLIPKLDNLANTGTKAFEWAQKNPGQVKAMAVAITVLAGALATYKIVTAAVSAGQKVAATVTKAFTAAQEGLDAAETANPIGLLVAAIAALVIGLVLAYKNSAKFRQIVNDVGNAVKVAFFAIIAASKAVAAAVVTAFNAVKGAVTTAFGAVVSAVSTTVHAISVVVGTVVNVMTLPFRIAVALILAIVIVGFKALAGPVTAALGVIGSVIRAVFGVYVTIVRTELAVMRAVISAVFNGIRLVISTVLGVVKTFITTEVHGWVRIITAIAGPVGAAARAVFNTAMGVIRAVLSTLAGIVSGPFHAVAGVIAKTAGAIESGAKTAFGGIKSAASAIAGDMVSIGGDIVHGLINGIESLAGTLSSAVTSFIKDNVPKPVLKLLHIGSPSKLFHQYGIWTAQGLANGILAGSPAVHAAATTMAAQLVKAGPWVSTVNPQTAPNSLAALLASPTASASMVDTAGSTSAASSTPGGPLVAYNNPRFYSYDPTDIARQGNQRLRDGLAVAGIR